jgi:DNA-binding transcriptional MerR regulator
MSDEIVIPDKPAFKAAEVCELLKLQPYVLRSWENEFKDLGVSKTPGGPRVYRRGDVERAARIRALMLDEGLTLAGVRRRFEQDSASPDAEDAMIAEIAATASAPPPPHTPASAPAAVAESPRVLPADRERVAQVRQGLRELLATLSTPAAATGVPREATPADGTATSPARRSVRSAPADPVRGAASTPAVAPPSPRPASVTPVAPVRELTVVPEDAEPSLFSDSAGGDEGISRGGPGRRPARRTS